MDLAIVVAVQVCIMFILIMLGFIIKRMGLVTKEGSKQLTNILLFLVTPCVLIKAYQVEFKTELVFNLLIAFAAAIAINILSLLVAKLFFGKKENEHSVINEYCCAYSNCGFMGIPLLEAVLGSVGVFYGSTYLAIFNILYWTHGVYIYSGDKKSLSLKKIIINPGVLGVVAGLFLFFTRIELPNIVMTAVGYMAGLNTPVAMLLLGIFLADVDLKKAIKNSKLYSVSFVRLVLIPALAVIILKLAHIPNEVAVAVVIPVACPCATASALFAAKYDLDAGYASEIVSLNTLMSIATLPLMVAFNSFVEMIF